MGALTNIKRKIGRFVGISALLLIAGVVHAWCWMKVISH